MHSPVAIFGPLVSIHSLASAARLSALTVRCLATSIAGISDLVSAMIPLSSSEFEMVGNSGRHASLDVQGC